MVIKIDLTAKIEIGSETTAGDFKDILAKIPDDGTARITRYLGDRPWESDIYTVEFSWTEER